MSIFDWVLVGIGGVILIGAVVIIVALEVMGSMMED